MRLESIRHRELAIDSWTLRPGQTWCVWGGNGSGKSQLAALVAGKDEPRSGQVLERPARVSWVSFETQQARFEEELRNDETDITDSVDIGTTGLELLMQSGCSKQRAIESARQHRVSGLLEKGYRMFSSGEIRRMLLLKEMLSQPDLLVLEEPFEGLDYAARNSIDQTCGRLVAEGQAILLLVSQRQDVASWVTHVMLLGSGTVVASAVKKEVLALGREPSLAGVAGARSPLLPEPITPVADLASPLVRMQNTRVVYGSGVQFQGVDWKLMAGEHTIVTGPNGAGKSTLLQLITGDHPQCYNNGLTVFGFRRGSGESVWDIKRHIGLVSAALHRDHRISGNALSVVVSGLHDSIGLYRKPDPAHVEHAMQWLTAIGLGDHSQKTFRRLSWGQQRLVLIARGLIKQPPLLILDEPTQGLDDANRQLVLGFVQRLVDLQRTTVLFVSHREDEHLALFKRRLAFVPCAESGVHFELCTPTLPRANVLG